MAKVNAYNNDTGKYQLVPEHWLDLKHLAFAQFTKEPRKKAAPAEPKKVTEPAKPENKGDKK